MTAMSSITMGDNTDHIDGELTGLFGYIESFTNIERGGYKPRVYRLSRMRRLLRLFGDPHKELRCIHIAGSKGKGSTATMIASILQAAGYVTGLYTSPHVHEYRERITRAGRFFPDHLYLEAGRQIRDCVETSLRDRIPDEELPSTFELLTLMAFLVFRNAEVDYVVLETGLGGRLDATNVVDPVASVLTPIELEHTEYLGDTVFEIAGEKAAIAKPGRPVFISPQSPDAEESFRRRLRGIGSSGAWLSRRLARMTSVSTTTGNHVHIECWIRAGSVPVTDRSPDAVGAAVAGADAVAGALARRRLIIDTRLTLLGRVQAENAALAALVCAEIMADLSADEIARGLASARMPGRGEIIRGPNGMAIVLDGAHTPRSVHALVELLREIKAQRCVVIFGSVEGKRYAEMIRALAPVTRHMVISRPGTFKPSDPSRLMAEAELAGLSAELQEDPRRALHAALTAAAPSRQAGPADAVVVTGSFYLLGEIRPLALRG